MEQILNELNQLIDKIHEAVFADKKIEAKFREYSEVAKIYNDIEAKLKNPKFKFALENINLSLARDFDSILEILDAIDINCRKDSSLPSSEPLFTIDYDSNQYENDINSLGNLISDFYKRLIKK